MAAKEHGAEEDVYTTLGHDGIAVKPYSWADVHDLARSLAHRLRDKRKTPTAIVGILRGGVIPAVILSHELGLRQVHALSVSSTTSNDPRAPRHRPTAHGIESVDLKSHDLVLIVDDVTNTGATLDAARALVADKAGCSTITVALLWDTVRESDGGSLSACHADIVSERLHAWPVFPWEVSEMAKDE